MRHEDDRDDEAARPYDTPGRGMFTPEVLGLAGEETQPRDAGRCVELAAARVVEHRRAATTPDAGAR
jgi:hypothetical protein